MAKLAVILGTLCLIGPGFAAERTSTVAHALKDVHVLVVPANGRPVERTVAEEFRRDLAPQAEIKTLARGGVDEKGVFRIAIADEKFLTGPSPDALRRAGAVFVDQFDRLRALRCYFRTLRNTAAWVAGVHGFIEAKDPAEKDRRLVMVRAMVDDEVANARALAALFEESKTRFMPVDPSGETFNMYGTNLPDLIRRKVALMEKHRNDEPRIDPNFMWRLPPDAAIDPKTYIKY